MTVIAVIGALAAAVGLGCTIVYGIDLYREWLKRARVLASTSDYSAFRGPSDGRRGPDSSNVTAKDPPAVAACATAPAAAQPALESGSMPA